MVSSGITVVYYMWYAEYGVLCIGNARQYGVSLYVVVCLVVMYCVIIYTAVVCCGRWCICSMCVSVMLYCSVARVNVEQC